MKNVNWFFDHEPPRGSPAGAAWRNTLAGTSQGSDRLAREAIQNSRDAQLGEGGPVEVRFAIRDLSGEAKAKLFELLHFDEGFRIHSLAEEAGLPKASTLRSEADDPVRILYVEDFGTTGLDGGLDDSGSNWKKFVFGLGEADKGEGGGSFGFGKSVFPAVSKSFSLVVYTVFGEGDRRLIGITFLNKHSIKGTTYTGRGWLCRFEDPFVRPIEGPEAQSMARELGFQRSSESGTSILVIDAMVDAKSLTRGIETHWWPAIEEGTLNSVVDSNEDPSLVPRPKLRSDLMPYLRAYRIATGAAEPEGDFEKRHDFPNLGIGVVGAVADREAPSDDMDPHAAPGNCVALVRNPRMVVQYLSILPRSSVSYRAVFIASYDMDAMFRQSEPPAHDKWEADQGRLECLDNPALAMDLVERLKPNLYSVLRSWILPLRPSPEGPSTRVRILDELLAKFIRISAAGSLKGPDSVTDPVTYESLPEEFERTAPDQVVLKFGARIKLKPDSENTTIEAWVRPACYPLLDASLRRDSGHKIPVSVRIEPPEAIVDQHDGAWHVSFCKESPVSVQVTTVPFDSRLIVEHELGLEGVP